ncbi:putative polyketide synthase [Xylariales sp. PMI_506]|nr:putative polyketide synthase [Xylariales sp. PMI_506]
MSDHTGQTDSAGVVFFGNNFPNDDLKDLFRRLTRHSKDVRFRTLAAFLETATDTLKDEIVKLSLPARDEAPHFDNFLGLVEHGNFRGGALSAAVESATMTALQIAMVIGHYEARNAELDLCQKNATLAGLSIGLFSGAAVALASTLADLVKTGAEALRVAFRLGVYIADFSRKLEAPHAEGRLHSWAHVVTGMSKEAVEEEVAKFNADNGGPELTKVFLSAADDSSISVTAPPSRLENIFHTSHALRYSKSTPLPVYSGICHGKHIYSIEDIQAVVDTASSLIPTSTPVRVALLSSASGEPYSASTSGELFQEISVELLTGTIYLDEVTANILKHYETNPTSSICHFSTFRTSLIVKGIEAKIEAAFPARDLVKTDYIAWAFEDFGPRRPRTKADSKIAIIGMSCRMPGGANNIAQFWDLLVQGRDVHTKIPPDRFDLETHYDPTGQTENCTTTEYGNFIDRPGFFDAGFFHMSPKEAEQTDPMQRYALVTAYEAMEMAGIVPNRTPSTKASRIGTWYGQAGDDWRETNASQNLGTYAVPGGVRGFLCGRINYHFKFSGPSFSVDTACSSSMAAVQAACTALWAGECDTAIAGGVNILTNPDNYAGLCNAHFLSQTGPCKVWDIDADGYCRGEGIGSIILKRLEDAEADNDNIIATVLSGVTNHSAEAVSITRPHAGAQRDNYRNAMNKAAVNPLDVTYVEMHGTGTQAGDAIESESVLDVFAPVTPRRRADQHLHLGAVKANIGHGEAAAGISSLIKALLAFQHNSLTPHVGIKTQINPLIPKDLEQRHVGLDFANVPWPRRQRGDIPRYAVVNAFGAHGGNTTLLLEDAPEVIRQRAESGLAEDRSVHTIAISARSKKSLHANLERLLSHITEQPDVDISDLSYTTCARRMHHHFRLATTVTGIPALKKFLESQLNGKTAAEVKSTPSEAPSVVMTFTGQGASYTGIDGILFKDFPAFRKEVLQIDRIVQRLGFPTVVPILDGSNYEEVTSPVVAQLSIVVLEIALARFWMSFGVTPSAVIGHSLGEYSAFAVSGILSVADALYLVGSRAALTQKLCTPDSHGMLSVRASVADIEQVVRADPKTSGLEYEISCRNTHHDTVLGAPVEVINYLREALERQSFKCIALKLPYAFHTAQMAPVMEEYEAVAKQVPFKAPSIPFLSTVLGDAVFDGKTIGPDYLKKQARQTVNFAGAVEAAQELGMVDDKTLWLDLGPHPVCVGFVRGLMPQARTLTSCRRNEDNITTLAKSLVALHLAGLTPAWHEYYRANERNYELLNLPDYSWNETNHWIPYYGTWKLDKAFLKYGGPPVHAHLLQPPQPVVKAAPPGLKSSTIHELLEEIIGTTTASLKIVSDIQQQEFLEAVNGHQMNNCGVATSAIWSDMAYNVGDYLYKKLAPKAENMRMSLQDFEVLHAHIAKKAMNSVQLISLEAYLDIDKQEMALAWYDVDAKTRERAADYWASATVRWENPAIWSTEFGGIRHLIQGRIETLQQLANEGKASRLSKGMAYTLFKNVVDYAPQYRAMDSVIIYGYEAMSELTLHGDHHGGKWFSPPHFGDPACHLAGLVCNGSDASNTKDFFYVTPGYDSFRMDRAFEAGAKYQNYVHMFPHETEANMWAGNLYILKDGVVVACLSQIKFKRVPRVLISRFFSAPDDGPSPAHHHAALTASSQKPAPVVIPAVAAAPQPVPAPVAVPVAVPVVAIQPQPGSVSIVADVKKKHSSVQVSVQPVELTPPSSVDSESVGNAESNESATVVQCMQLISRETSIGLSDLDDDANFAQLGVDSLMSLVLSEKFRAELGFEVKSSVFIECPTIGELKAWIDQNC